MQGTTEEAAVNTLHLQNITQKSLTHRFTFTTAEILPLIHQATGYAFPAALSGPYPELLRPRVVAATP